jgi:tetratricopeptide (TPR) repeat protein
MAGPLLGLWGVLGLGALMAVVEQAQSRPEVPRSDAASGAAAPAADREADARTYVRPPSARFALFRPSPVFFGREDELEAIKANFERGAFITSASGSLGVGTTALARHLAAELADQFPDGCLEIDLRGAMPNLLTPLDPVEAQRRLLWPFYPDEQLPEDKRALHKLYRKTFSQKKVLLVLDNAAGPGQLRYLMPRKPSAALVTARTEFSVLSKLYPVALEGLRPDAAGKLLRRLAPCLEDVGQRWIGRLVDRFEGNPLALRIVASLLRAPFDWTPRTLIQRYTATYKRLVALRDSNANLNVSIALELIYEALPEELRTFFDTLAVFSAPFKKTAAAAVWNVPVDAAEETLTALVRSNLLDYSPELDLYALHDLTRFYMQELLLGQPDQTRAAMARYATYVLAEASLASDQYRAASGATSAEAALFRLTIIWPHLWSAWLRMGSTDPGWPQPGNVDNWLCDFPLRVMPVLKVMLPPKERLPLLERAVEAARRLDRGAEGKLLNNLGQIYATLGEAEQALACHEQHLQLAYETHDRAGEASALMHIGLNCGALGDIARARDSWRHALALFRMMGDPRADQIRAWLAAVDQKLGR